MARYLQVFTCITLATLSVSLEATSITTPASIRSVSLEATSITTPASIRSVSLEATSITTPASIRSVSLEATSITTPASIRSVSLEATSITTPASIRKLEYVCEPDGSMTITVPPNYSLQNIGNSQCTRSHTNSYQFKLTNCKNKSQTIALKHKKVLGGKLPIFSLLCMDAKYTMQLNATANNIGTSVSPTPMPTQPISYNDKIKMMIKDNKGNQAISAVIGETLSLVISAPQYFKIDPLKCSAVSGNSSYPIWDANSAM